jgi:hypothetical protein
VNREDEQADPGLYVGYLPVPRAYLRTVRVAVPLAFWLLAVAAMVWAAGQRSPGDGQWEDGLERSFSGTVRLWPYPMLLEAEMDGQAVGTALVVEVGKRGARERLAAFEGQRVILRGWRLARSGKVMVEVNPDEAVVADSRGRAASGVGRVGVRGRSLQLWGEIVDAKCYLGAMRPGDGKTHKACATLCIRGGLPAVLVVRERLGEWRQSAENGDVGMYLVRGEDGSGLPEALWPLIGEPVRVQGEVGEVEGWRTITVKPGGV